MTRVDIDDPTVSRLKLAVGPLDHLSLIYSEQLEVVLTLAWFLGDSLDSATFLTEVPKEAADEHRVYWLGEKTIGCLVIGRHQGPQGAHEWPTQVSGYVRPISDVRRVELQDMKIEWPQFGDRRIPELEPNVVIQFNDGETLEVSVASRTTEVARQQAATFINRLKTVFAST